MNDRSPLSHVIIDNINRHLGDERGVNTRLGEYLGVHSSAVSKWRKGGHLPHIDTIERIADFIGIPIADLVRRRPGRKAKL